MSCFRPWSSATRAELLDHLEAAIAASLLSESTERVGRFRFVHALINQTLYEGLGATRRARMHQRVAQALEQLYGADPGERLGELALHWRLAAVSVDRAKAADYALAPGSARLRASPRRRRVKLFTDALELLGTRTSAERCRRSDRPRRGPAPDGRRGLPRDAARGLERCFGAAGRRACGSRSLANHRGMSGSRTFGEVDEARIEAIERAIELDDPPHPGRRGPLLALQSQELSWDPDFARRCALADEAVAVARSAGRRALADALFYAFHGTWSAETLESRAALTQELTGLAEELRDPAVDQAARYAIHHVYVERGELSDAENALRRVSAAAEELGQPTQVWLSTYERAGLALLRGHLAEGEGLAEQAFEIGKEAQPTDAIQVYGGQLGFIRRYQGRSAELIELVEQQVNANPSIAAWRASLAVSLSLLDRRDEATAILDDAVSDGLEHVPSNVAMLATLCLYAEVAVQTQNVQAAQALRERLEPFSTQIAWIAIAGYGHVRLWLGLLAAVVGEPNRADEHLDFACQFHGTNDMPLWAARGHLGWAEALAPRGDAERRLAHATRALELSREHGYGAFEPRALALVETASAAGA